jgi:pimeloyl-ACP methyl ester carboxylesterase
MEINKMTAVSPSTPTQHPVHYRTARIGDLDIFYRDAGPQAAPVIFLLHGFPTSSNMFRNLIPRLAGSFRVVAPDYPGFGQSSMPDRRRFAYTLEEYANNTMASCVIIGERAGEILRSEYKI